MGTMRECMGRRGISWERRHPAGLGAGSTLDLAVTVLPEAASALDAKEVVRCAERISGPGPTFQHHGLWRLDAALAGGTAC